MRVIILQRAPYFLPQVLLADAWRISRPAQGGVHTNNSGRIEIIAGAGISLAYFGRGGLRAAAPQKGMLEGNPAEAIQSARQGVERDPKNYILQTILGQALIRSGAGPGQAEFVEAETALERAVAARPNFAAAQLALGQLYLAVHRLDVAIKHLEIARQLAPANTSVYSHLAVAYRRQGDPAAAQKMLAILATLNQGQAAKYKSGPPEHKASYSGSGPP